MKYKLKEIISYIKQKQIDYADARYVNSMNESITVSNSIVDNIVHNTNAGIGIRVLYKGAWGFASTADMSSESLKSTADRAIQIARASATTIKNPAKLAEQEVFVDYYKTKIKKDPFAIPLEDKIKLLVKTTDILKNDKKIKNTEASMGFFKTNKIFISTEGAEIEQDIYESGAGCYAVAYDGKVAQKRSYPNSLGRVMATRGYEFVEEMNFEDNVDQVREEAIELLSAEDCPDTTTDIIIGAPQLSLQIHESCGHPIELDRVLGTEISLAGSSFMTVDNLNKLKYGSDIVNINADATIPGALGTFGYDDEGVKAQRKPIIQNGVHVGYLTSRETAPVIDQRSNGTMRADGWNRTPIIRMTNINLEPGDWELDDLIADTKDGIFFDLNKSWSIDDKRLNFQFAVEAAWEIKNGKKGKMFKNALYTGITPKFWNSCDAICNKNHWQVWGTPNCGKGEPMQVARVGHGSAPSRFRKVKVGVSK